MLSDWVNHWNVPDCSIFGVVVDSNGNSDEIDC